MNTKTNIPHQIKQYRLLNNIGSGGFSTVFLGLNTITNSSVAIKVVPKTKLARPHDNDRFQRELNVTATFRHQGITQLLDFFWDEDHFYLIEEYCEGGDLFNYLCDHGALEESLASVIFGQLISVVQFCHQNNIAHRDLKPENIFFDKFPHVKLGDFGLCGEVKNNELMTSFCGSQSYCAPECLKNLKYDGKIADVWSLGVILFILVTGTFPWTSKNESIRLTQIINGLYQIPSNISQECQNLISAMLHVNPESRVSLELIKNCSWVSKNADYFSKTPPGVSNSQSHANLLSPQKGILLDGFKKGRKSLESDSGTGIYSPFIKKIKIIGGNEEDEGPIELSEATARVNKKIGHSSINYKLNVSNTQRFPAVKIKKFKCSPNSKNPFLGKKKKPAVVAPTLKPIFE